MPRKLTLSPDALGALLDARRAGASYDTIAAAAGVSRGHAIKLCRAHGVVVRVPTGAAAHGDRVPVVWEGRRPGDDPLPPGHPDTWGLLTAGTVLEGVAYG